MALNKVINHLKNQPVELKIHAISENHNMGGHRAPVSLIAWKSKKLRRKAGNTLLCESISLSTALGAMEKQIAMWESLCKSHYNPRNSTLPPEIEKGLRGPATVIAWEAPSYVDPMLVAVTDAKSLYDGTTTEQAQGECDRSALEIAIIQESLAQCRGRLRWVPHNRNPTDALTKVEGVHMEPLLNLLRSNTYQIEEDENRQKIRGPAA